MARTVLSRPSVNARCDTVVNGEPSVRTGFAPKALTLRVGDLFELLPSCDFSMGFSFPDPVSKLFVVLKTMRCQYFFVSHCLDHSLERHKGAQDLWTTNRMTKETTHER